MTGTIDAIPAVSPETAPSKPRKIEFTVTGDDDTDEDSLRGSTIPLDDQNEEVSVVSPVKQRFISLRRTKSRSEKESCEYYDETSDLHDGELPSLKWPGRTPVAKRILRAVSPSSPFQSRSTTPVLDNTKGGRKSSQRKKKNSSKDEADMVSISATKLSPDAKRKHRAFWNQFDVKPADVDADTSEDDGSNTDAEPQDDGKKGDAHIDKPIDERQENSTLVKRKAETLEDEDEDGINGGIYGMMMDLCSDCGWMGESKKEETLEKSRAGAPNNMAKQSKNKSRGLTHDSHKANNTVSLMSDDDEPDDEVQDESSTRRNKSMSNRTRRNVIADRVSEEFEDHDLKLEESNSLPSEPETSTNQSTKTPNEPHNYENTTIEIEYEDKNPKGKFLQLNDTGDIAVFSRPGAEHQRGLKVQKSKSFGGLGETPVPSDERAYGLKNESSKSDVPLESTHSVSYLLNKSKSWSKPQKNAYLQAMALKAKEDFRKKKELSDEPKTVVESPKFQSIGKFEDDDDSLSAILDESPVKRSRSHIDWSQHDWTPSEKRRLFHLVKSEGLTPERATEIMLASKAEESQIPEILEQAPTRNNVNSHSSSFKPSPSGVFVATRNIEREEADDSKEIPHPQFTNQNANVERKSKSDHGANYSSDSSFAKAPLPQFANLNENVGKRSMSDHGAMDSRTCSTILSNLKQKPGFSKVVENNHQSRSVPIASQNLSRSISKSVERLPNAKAAGGSIFSMKSRKKKGSEKGLSWHEIDDQDYNSDENEMVSNGFKDIKKDVEKSSNDIFDFDAPADTSKDDDGPVSSLMLDPYSDSCDVSILGSINGFDATSTVVSGRSMYTTATNASACSTSTRRRHRGAAKNRKPEETKKPVGWLETIKAAAESNNKTWNPEAGWVDYKETHKPVELEFDGKKSISRIGKLKPIIAKSKRDLSHESHKVIDNDAKIMNSNIPFPSGWEKERDEMASVIKDDDVQSTAATEVIRNVNNVNEDNTSRADTEVASNKLNKFSTKTQLDYGIPETIGEDSMGDDDESSTEDEQHTPEIRHDQNPARTITAPAVVTPNQNKHDANEIQMKRSEPQAIDQVNTMPASNSSETKPSDRLHQDEENKPSAGGYFSFPSSENMDETAFERNKDDSEENDARMVDPYSDKNDTAFVRVPSSSIEDDTDGGEFATDNNSFDFSADGTSFDGDGFKVIENSDYSERISKSIRENKKGKSSISNEQDSNSMNGNDDKSVRSSTSMMSSRAKEWRKKVEIGKRSSESEFAESNGAIFVSAVDDNSTVEVRSNRKVDLSDEDDTLFEFRSDSPFRADSPQSNANKIPRSNRGDTMKKRSVSSSNRKSRIPSDDQLSDITNPTVDSQPPKREETFFQRMQSCSTDVIETCDKDKIGSGLPKAHLQFLRNAASMEKLSCKPQNKHEEGGFINMITSTGFCGSPEVVDEEVMESKQNSSSMRKSNLASQYLDSINRGKSTREVKKSPSVISSASSQSETWKRFLEKREKAFSPKRPNDSGVSKAAEKYATQKVDEIIQRVNQEKPESRSDQITRPQSHGRQRNIALRSSSAGRPKTSDRNKMMSRDDAAKAAEDLAAARVEAMMAMTPGFHGQNENEI